jgi:hypothetical protein
VEVRFQQVRGHGRSGVLALMAVALLCGGSARAAATAADAEIAAAASLLRTARELRGEPGRKDELLARAAGEHPVIADHAERLRAELWLEEGDMPRAIEAVQRALRADPKTPLRARLLRLEGRARSEAGAEGEARAA